MCSWYSETRVAYVCLASLKQSQTSIFKLFLTAAVWPPISVVKTLRSAPEEACVCGISIPLRPCSCIRYSGPNSHSECTINYVLRGLQPTCAALLPRTTTSPDSGKIMQKNCSGSRITTAVVCTKKQISTSSSRQVCMIQAGTKLCWTGPELSGHFTINDSVSYHFCFALSFHVFYRKSHTEREQTHWLSDFQNSTQWDLMRC